jgi:protein TonB
VRDLRVLHRLGELLRENGAAATAAAVILALVGVAAWWIAKSRDEPPQKKVLTITGVIVKPDPPPARPPPPPPPQNVPKVEEEQPQSRLVEVKATDIPPPDAPRPEPAAGPLALATEATGEGDAFNLAGNPGGRNLLGPGGIGDGTGDGVGGGGDAGSRYGWYFGRIATEIEDAFRKMKKTRTAQARVEIKVWVEPDGRVSRVQLLRSTGDPELDQAIRSVVGVRLREALPPDIPSPVIYRFTARRPG